ncbi:F-box domain-containing protein [Strongyloides ratti]|uniref:F-box domain-containing protein n=1 Tax=Strongyloides ratti TaxID=34506 RepID=A0A090MY68_STRRB|nr:F-box domain-containing protein [Strongyloides ratti]CEF66659.1 F-box domain-containing protein [Strongyloides ratti]
MEFLSLPEPFRIQVLKNLDWKSLINAKLVSRGLYLTIEKNINFMDRPKIKNLGIYCDKKLDDKEIIRVRYSIFPENCILRKRLKVIHFEDLNEYEQFLQKLDFSKLDYLHFRICDTSDVVGIFNKYYCGGNYIETFVLDDTGESEKKNANNVLNLISKIKDVGKMYLTLNFPFQKLPMSFMFPEMGSLKEFSIEEKNGTRLITTKMIINIINNNPGMAYFKVSTDSESFYMKVTECIFELEAFNMENRCSHTPFEISFFNITNFTLSEERFYRELFNKFNNRSDFEVTNDNGNYNFKKTVECSKCKIQHLNLISYDCDLKIVKIVFM